MKTYIIVVATFFIAAGCQQKSDPYRPELIFVSDRDAKELGIFRTDTTASFVERVYQGTTATAYGLNWTNAGREIYFNNYIPGNTEIYRLELDSGILTNISNHPSNDGGANLSPDGEKIVFESNRHHRSRELYLLDIATGDTTRLTYNEVYDAASRFSPDGSTIAFCRQVAPPDSAGHAGNGEIFTYDLTSQAETRVTDKPGFDCLPDWAPDNNTLAFHGCTSEGCNIFTINKDGTGLRRVTDDEFDNRWPRWSPDGKWIAYTSVRNGQSDIYIIRPDGSGLKQITSHPGRDEVAEWKPMNNN